MPDSRAEEQPNPKPSTPPVVPSPPLPPGIKPAAAAPKTASTPPIPSPPLPPKTAPVPSPPTPSTVAASEERHFAFKLADDDATTKTPASPVIATPSPPPAPSTRPTAAPSPSQTPPAPRTPSVERTPAIPRTAAAPRPAVQAPSPVLPNANNPIGTGASAPHPAPHATTHQEEEYHGLSFGAEVRNWIEKADPVTATIFRIALFGGALSLAFILYAIFITKIGVGAIPTAQANNLKLAATIFHWSAILLALMGILIALDMKALGFALIVGGLALHFGAPWALFGFVGKTNAVRALSAALSGTGMWLVYLGILRGAFDLMQWIIELPDRKKQRADVGVGRKAEAAQLRVAREANAFSPCWKLPFCREVIRKQCPAFLAKKTCWKFGRGCYCDEEMISRIIKGESLEVIKAPTRLSKTGKAPCGRCHIYLEHQGYKYKILSPLAVPATGIIMYFVWPIWTKVFLAFSNAPFWDSMSFDKKRFTPDAISTTAVVDPATQIPETQVIHIATVLLGVLLGFYVLIYVCKFIEWFVYKVKL